jgi:hypothetical protein
VTFTFTFIERSPLRRVRSALDRRAIQEEEEKEEEEKEEDCGRMSSHNTVLHFGMCVPRFRKRIKLGYMKRINSSADLVHT